ncbi:MAG: hypothetical protein F4X41_07235 [Chloroflexi bacterium]|nr:hypothetical protein [Chloroflexota bacterium]
MNNARLDRYGGWTGKKFSPSGYFRTEKDGRWWLVSPEGNGFLSFGINHLHPEFWNQAYNRAAWRDRLGLDDLDGPGFAVALRRWFLETCRGYGFNTVGVHADLAIANLPRPAMAYMLPIQFVDIPHWQDDVPDESFVDVFAPEFERRCDRLAAEIAGPARQDPYLLGYAMTDCPLLTEEDCRERPDTIGGAARGSRVGWPQRLRNLGQRAAGKSAYVETVRGLYRDDIADFNRTYGTRFDSFAALARTADWRPGSDPANPDETRDNTVFLQRVVDRYYRTARDAITRHDPNHLFFGDKLNANTDSLDTVLPVTARHTDVLFYQMYGRYAAQQPGLERWAEKVDLPVVNGDSAYTMITADMPRPYGPVADDLGQRRDWTVEFFRAAFARPEFVGWHYCGLVDAPNRIARKRGRQHSGLIDGFGEPYPLLREALSDCADELYRLAGADQ